MLRDASLIPLSHQHHNGLALCVLLRRSLQKDRTPENIARLAARVIERNDLELKNHFSIEEEVLFPAVAPYMEDPALIEGLIADHRRVEEIVQLLATAPEAKSLEEFMELLPGHIRREEKDLFEQAQARVPRAILDKAGIEIDARAVRLCLDAWT